MLWRSSEGKSSDELMEHACGWVAWGGWSGAGRKGAVGCEVWWAGLWEGRPGLQTTTMLLRFFSLERTSLELGSI